MMRPVTKEEIRAIQLELLDDVHTFCSRHNLRYSLCGGTMLGAVRHHGYIPWDDDIDPMMLRQDYDRFIQEYAGEKNEVVDLSRIETCEEQFIKVSRKGTIMKDVLMGRELFGVNIDIFPIDGMPEDFRPYTATLQNLHQTVKTICPRYKSATRHKLYWYLRHCAKGLFQDSEKRTLALKSQLNATVRQHLPEQSPLSTVIFGDFVIYPFPTSVFEVYDDILFEGKNYRCIQERDLYLSTVYGNYMQLPPVEKRVSHHHYDAYIEE